MIRYAIYSDTSVIYDLLNTYVSFGLSTREHILTLINQRQILVYEDKEKVIGVLTFSFNPPIHEILLSHEHICSKVNPLLKKQWIYIQAIAVEPFYRNQRISSRLLQQLLTLFPDFSFILCLWHHPNGWKSDTSLYRMNFHKIHTQKKFFYHDSVKNHYGCPYCGNVCRCSVSIYVN